MQSFFKILLATLLVNFNLSGQSLDIKILQQGTAYTDSSFYDIIEVEDAYWIAGKYGILKSYTDESGLENISYPSRGVDIYKMAFNQKGELLAAGDQGVIYKYDLSEGSWKVKSLKGYEKSCFYNLTKAEDGTLYISGGNTKIAHSRKSIPRGFILRSTDNGNTWQEIYRNLFRMVWSVQENPFDHSLYALMYTPNKTHLYELNGKGWAKREKIGNTIYHYIDWQSEDKYIASGGWIGKKGRIHLNQSEVVMENTGLIWSRTENERYELYTACNGTLVLGNKKGEYQTFHKKLNRSFSLYEAVFISPNEALVIGSARTLLKVKINEVGI